VAVIDDAAQMIRTRLDELNSEKEKLERVLGELGSDAAPVEAVLLVAANRGRSQAAVVPRLRKPPERPAAVKRMQLASPGPSASKRSSSSSRAIHRRVPKRLASVSERPPTT